MKTLILKFENKKQRNTRKNKNEQMEKWRNCNWRNEEGKGKKDSCWTLENKKWRNPRIGIGKKTLKLEIYI